MPNRSDTLVEPVELDRTDLRILAELQRDGRLTNQELAERVSLSPSPCLRRVRRLEETGVIRGYAALIEPRAVGLGVVIVTYAMPQGLRRRTVGAVYTFTVPAAPVR